MALIGMVGYIVYRNHHKTTVATKTTTSTTSTPKATTSQTDTLKIPELGIQIVNIPSSISDLNYAITGKDSTGGSIAEISTASLSKLDQSCSPTGKVSADGTLASYTGIYDANSVPEDNTAFVKQFSGFWICFIATLSLSVPILPLQRLCTSPRQQPFKPSQQIRLTLKPYSS